jgi:hypothetical protein
MSSQLSQLRAAIDPARKAVLAHPMYARLDSPAAVVAFMEHHVWAVWDFMSLLKSLQAGLTCVTVPWVPNGPPSTRRLVNEIVLAEESDEAGPGYASHFELYLAAMREAGANTGPVENFVARLKWGEPTLGALYHVLAPAAADAFVGETFALLHDAPLHAQAAAFAFAREDLIPEMFARVAGIGSPRLAGFSDYLVRHIELDTVHGKMASEMVEQLCGDDAARWAAAQAAAEGALRARARLWDGVLAAIG